MLAAEIFIKPNESSGQMDSVEMSDKQGSHLRFSRESKTLRFLTWRFFAADLIHLGVFLFFSDINGHKKY